MFLVKLNICNQTHQMEYGVSVQNVFAVESNAIPSLDDIKKLPNKVLLWCGSRSSNLLRHIYKGFLPAVCSLPVPGYMIITVSMMIITLPSI
ncbi:Poly(ADP-ribose) polymerase catalytic domain [Arabidopsis thaliana x Arabidopsis arenosa]|uniref:Poly [ADP-ribose] polymerase n=1 Tax=Arabidopsis thaliana x Arabidopsis arenosa TaxID=1240361 RepID=A0A8T1Z0Q9_9BRAS|nr:Poly(ADP-ribose) polymerase catalytic domain [Arabidopsis thaliana x Arabidopsis arenosa]